ncbi:MAG: DUF1801 domain-containing protein [Chitinophagaceae bacterium]|nr:MAG: DUF1801 domain-containing protein [Chitinophagaceae bacterium]
MTSKLPAKETGSAAVYAIVHSLDPSLRKSVDALREVITAASPLVSEHVKWNSPAFFYNGTMKPFDPKEYKRDIAVMNLHRGRLMLVFPTGAVIKDDTGLLTGSFKDGRRIIEFSSLQEVEANREQIISIIRKWISLVD